MQNSCYKVILLIIFINSSLMAENRSNFLTHGPSVASFARGETGTASYTDISSIFYNPSLGTEIQGGTLGIAHYMLLDGASYNFFGIGRNINDTLFLGFHLLNLQSGDIELRQFINETPSVTRTNQWAWTISSAAKIRKLCNSSLGFSIKYIFFDLAGRKAGGTGLDLGLSRKFNGPLVEGNTSIIKIGFSAQNLITPKLTMVSVEESLSTAFRLGLSISAPVIYRYASFDSVSIFSDILYDEYHFKYFAGLEYSFWSQFSLRAGFFENHLTAGAGYRKNSFKTDYAVDINDLSSFHRFGFSYYWENGKSKKEERRKKRSASLMNEAWKTLKESNKLNHIREKEAKPLFKTAKRHYRKKEFLKASVMFQDIILRYPELSNAAFYFEKINKYMNDIAEKENILHFKELSYAKGFVNYRNQRYKESLNEWKKVLQLSPENNEIIEYSNKIAGDLKNIKQLEDERVFETRLSELFKDAMNDYGKKKWVSCIKKLEIIKKTCRQETFGSSIDWYRKTTIFIDKAILELSKMTLKNKSKEPDNGSNETAHETDIDGADKKYNEGLVLYAQGKIGDAIRIWEISLRLYPGHKKAIKALKRAREEIESVNSKPL